MTDGGYVELHCHSNFSLLDGASHPEDLAVRAAELGMPALALTDHDAVYGAARFARAAQIASVRPIFGAEMTLDGGGHLTLLVEDAAGWRNLCALISLARAGRSKGQAALPPGALEDHAGGLVALSGCRKGDIPAALLRGDRGQALAAARRWRDVFRADRFWIELHNHLLPEDDALIADLIALAEATGLEVVAANNVHYAPRDGHRLQDVLVCVKHLATLEASEPLRRPNSEYYLKSARQMAPLFPNCPHALANTLRIAERCEFALEYGLQDLPRFPTPEGLDTEAYLRQVCLATLPGRYPHSSAEAGARLDYELGVIARSGLANYFLIVWDIVRCARQRGIRCQGRGSAANSLVAYLLGISPIDPLAHDLVFERFLSDERRLPPDIDLDIEAPEGRGDLIQYVYERYGHDRAAMACAFVTFRARSAIRDVGRALGLPPRLIDHAAKAMESHDPGKIGETVEAIGSQPWAQLLDLCAQIDGFPRHLGIHNGGMVITGAPLAGRLPTEPAAMPGRTVVQWDKDSLEEAGLVKIDLLGLRMLSVLADAGDLIEQASGARPDLDGLTFDDPAVYDLIASADTVGVFQVESRAQAQMLPRMRPRCFSDIIVAISLIRPGPIIGQMVHPYLRRRLGDEPVSYLHPKLKPALEETLGVILFQEQVLKVARDIAGFSAGQGEILRRALGSKRAAALMEQFHASFIEGAQQQGVPAEVAEEVFSRLRGFGSYSFPKSHAAAFAVVVYQSAWLKRYYPAAFYVALLNNQPMGFWSPAVIVSDAKRHGIVVLPVDVNRSQAHCILEDSNIRLGLQYVHGVGGMAAARIEEAHEQRPFSDLKDFCRRTRLPRGLVENLILAGGLDSFGERRGLLLALARLRYEADDLDLIFPDDGLRPPPMDRAEALGWEEAMLGMTVGEHPMALCREWLETHGVLDSRALEDCRSGQVVRVAGLNVMHQAPPTAKGVHFITLEDEWGMINLVVHRRVVTQTKKSPFWQGYGLSGHRFIVVEGVVQRKGTVINVVANRVFPLSHEGLAALNIPASQS